MIPRKGRGGRKARWWHVLQAAKQEALIAVDLYNRPRADRSLEACVVHMMMAWLHLLHARFLRDKIDHCYRDSGGRVETIDGEPKTWDLARCAREHFPNGNPMRTNLEFFIPLRNRVEHRYFRILDPIVAGKIQALVMNFERTLMECFGVQESLGDSLRFPVFLSTLSDDGVTALKKLYARLPAKVRGFLEAYDAALPEEVRDHPHYEFKVVLIQKVGNRGEPDLAIEFIKRSDLTDTQREQLDTAVVLVRDRQVEVQHFGKLRPKEVVTRVAEKFPWFNMEYHTLAWRHGQVRPPAKAPDPAVTDGRYCHWDQPHKDYIYTDAWARHLITSLQQGPDGFTQVIGKAPKSGFYPLPINGAEDAGASTR